MFDLPFWNKVQLFELLTVLLSPPLFTQVARHLAKLFDSMARLKFKQDEEGKPTKEALGMYSKDGEYVDFDKPCVCVGQVENWLNILLDTMQSTIRHEFTEAVVTYEEKPREQWIFDPPAQVTCKSLIPQFVFKVTEQLNQLIRQLLFNTQLAGPKITLRSSHWFFCIFHGLCVCTYHMFIRLVHCCHMQCD